MNFQNVSPRARAKGKKVQSIFSSVETASGQLVPVPGGCQGSLASSWRHVLAFLAWCCYLHIVIEFTISSFTGISGVGISKTRKLTVPFELKVYSSLSLWSPVFPRFLSFRGKLWGEFLVESQVQMGKHPLAPHSITQYRLSKFFKPENCFWP